MLKLYDNGIYLVHGETICSCPEEAAQKSGITTTKEEAAKGTMAYGILKAHNQSDDTRLRAQPQGGRLFIL